MKAIKTAEFIKTYWIDTDVDKRLYKLSEQVQYLYGYDDLKTEFIVVSGCYIKAIDREETYIFASDKTGKITCWAEMDGSFNGGIDHEKAINDLGFSLVATPINKSNIAHIVGGDLATAYENIMP